MNDQRIERLLKAFEVTNDQLTREEFTAAFKKILDHFSKMQTQLLGSIDYKQGEEKSKLEKLAQDFTTQAEKIVSDAFEKSPSKQKMEEMFKQMLNKMGEIDTKLSKVKDGKPGLPGKNADEQKIIDRLLKMIVLPKIDYTEIEKIRKEWDDFRQQRVMLGGGGFSKIAMDGHIVDEETPSGTVNGSNDTFTLAFAPNPTASLKVYQDGQRMKGGGVDYTLSGRTITFTSAPLSNTILTCEYRT